MQTSQTGNRQVLLQAAEAELKSNADLLVLSVRICGCTSSSSCTFVDTPCYSISAATAAVGCQSLSCGMHYACWVVSQNPQSLKPSSSLGCRSTSNCRRSCRTQSSRCGGAMQLHHATSCRPGMHTQQLPDRWTDPVTPPAAVAAAVAAGFQQGAPTSPCSASLAAIQQLQLLQQNQ